MSRDHGKIYWTELMTEDCAAAMAFYGSVCGWEFTSMPAPGGAGDYHIGLRDGEPAIGMMALADMDGIEDMAPQWLSYVAVDDLAAAVERAIAAGGRLLRPVFEVPGTGHIAMITDPGGAVLGLMTPEPMDAPANRAAQEDDDLLDNLPV